MRIEASRDGDRARVLELLEGAALPAAGVDRHFDAFLIARPDDEQGPLAGCIGLETYEDVGLLRSLVVQPDARSSGVGRLLVERLLERARAKGLRFIYLLTTTAERYFPRFGFEVLGRDEVDARLYESEEFRGACPESAVLMRLAL